MYRFTVRDQPRNLAYPRTNLHRYGRRRVGVLGPRTGNQLPTDIRLDTFCTKINNIRTCTSYSVERTAQHVVHIRDGLNSHDLKLYTELELNGSHTSLQKEFDLLSSWCIKWQLTISIKKCSILYIGNVSKIHHDDLFINAACLPSVSTVKDLGILIDSQLKLDLHINSIVAKAHSRACLIFRCFISKDGHSLIKAFITYVHPFVEYASCVWSPSSFGLIRKIEAVQKRFTKRLPGLNFLDYHERLALLGLESLELRRLKLIFV